MALTLPLEVDPAPLAPRHQVLPAITVPVDRLDQVIVVPGEVQGEVRLSFEGPGRAGPDVPIPAQAVEVLDGVAHHEVGPAVDVPVEEGQRGPARLASPAVELDRSPRPVGDPLARPKL